VTEHYGFGTSVSADDLVKYLSVHPDGRGLPSGSGTALVGAKVYAENCLACHGDKLQGNPEPKGIGGDPLIGGRGSLATNRPLKTVESYWPYSTTLFDYVKRAMPFMPHDMTKEFNLCSLGNGLAFASRSLPKGFMEADMDWRLVVL
jgi:cytochrome c